MKEMKHKENCLFLFLSSLSKSPQQKEEKEEEGEEKEGGEGREGEEGEEGEGREGGEGEEGEGREGEEGEGREGEGLFLSLPAQNSALKRDPNLLFPSDLLPFTRKPLFLVIERDRHFPIEVKNSSLLSFSVLKQKILLPNL